MTLGVSGGDYIYQNYLSSMAKNDTGFYTAGSVTLSGGLVLYSASGTYLINGSYFSNPGSYLTFTTGSTVPRIDLVWASGAVYGVTQGAYPALTERANPPQLLAYQVAVAHVTVGSNVSALTNANVRDIQNRGAFVTASGLHDYVKRSILLGLYPRDV